MTKSITFAESGCAEADGSTAVEVILDFQLAPTG